MMDQVQIEIRGRGARLTVEFLHRASLKVQDEWEGDGIVARIRAKTPTTAVDFTDRVRLFDLVRFRESLVRSDVTPSWRAWLGDAQEYLIGIGERDTRGGLR